MRASTLYRMLDNATKRLVDAAQWFVEDWTAMALVQHQPFYAVDPKWHRVTDAFVNRWPIRYVVEGLLISPSRREGAQPIYLYHHKRSDHMEIGCDVVPNASDP